MPEHTRSLPQPHLKHHLQTESMCHVSFRWDSSISSARPFPGWATLGRLLGMSTCNLCPSGPRSLQALAGGQAELLGVGEAAQACLQAGAASQ